MDEVLVNIKRKGSFEYDLIQQATVRLKQACRDREYKGAPTFHAIYLDFIK